MSDPVPDPEERAEEPEEQPPATRTIDGRYVLDLTRDLATGGREEIRIGQDIRSRETVIARTLRPEWRNDTAERARFRREARMLAFMKHPNIVRVEAFVEEPDSFWIVQEHLGGGSVAARIHRDGPFTVEAVSPVLDQAADALAEIHARGLVHLAVTPDHLAFDDDGRTVKLIGLGLAIPAGSVPGGDGGVGLDAAWRSPEHLNGLPVTPASDQFSLAAVAFTMVTARTPGGGVLARQVRPELPGWLDEVLVPALGIDPADRYPDIREFADYYRAGIEGRLTGQPIDVPAPVEQRQRPSPPDAQWLTLPVEPRSLGAAPGAISGRQRGELGIPRRVRLIRVARWLWLAIGALLLVNLLLAGVLMARDGAVPPFEARPRVAAPASGTFSPGDVAVVTGIGLLVRQEPSMSAAPTVALTQGERVTIAGPPVIVDDRQWWPVLVTRDDGATEGYVPDGWLAPAR
jgi:hypothetical protein